LNLKWNDFQENALSAFGTLREDSEFADVTLVCQDGQQVEAHKVILSSSSPFFLNLLRRNKHSHPLIFMRGLKSTDLVAIVDFLYFGEANVYQENLDSFLAVAEELQLKGLMGPGAIKEEVEDKKSKPKNITPKHLKRRNYIPAETFDSEDKVEAEPPLEGTVAVTDFTVATELQDLDDKIKSMMDVSENKNDQKGQTGFKRICKVCGKEGHMSLIMNHIDTNHITGVSHACNICGKISRSRNSLAVHKSRVHGKLD